MAKLLCPQCAEEITNYNINDGTIDCPACTIPFVIKNALVTGLKNAQKRNVDSKGITKEINQNSLNLGIH